MEEQRSERLSEEGELVFAEEGEPRESHTKEPHPWKILLADDEEQVHAVTKMALAGFSFEGRRLEIFSAFSGEETKKLIREHPDTALLLLDVVMERDDSGLDVVRHIRETLQNTLVRIVLRTGQPGQAPEERVVNEYDVNDYREKTDLTVPHLRTLVTASLRSYRDLLAIEEGRRGFELLARQMSHIFEPQSFPSFLETALVQLIALMHPDEEMSISPSGLALSYDKGTFTVLAGMGNFRNLVGTPLALLPQDVRRQLDEAISKRRSIFLKDSFVGFFRTKCNHESLLFLQGDISEVNRRVLMVFAANLTDAFDYLTASTETGDMQKEIILTLAELIETRSHDTANHVRRMGEYCFILAREAGFSEESANLLRIAALMHDVGKIGIPDLILKKPERLDSEEFEIVKTHASLGYCILKNSSREVMRAASRVALQHHERWDGRGYPQGLAGEDIDVFARIVCLADVFDALVHRRVYKEAWPIENALAQIRRDRGMFFDPRLVDCFFARLEELLSVKEAYPDHVNAH